MNSYTSAHVLLTGTTASESDVVDGDDAVEAERPICGEDDLESNVGADWNNGILPGGGLSSALPPQNLKEKESEVESKVRGSERKFKLWSEKTACGCYLFVEK